MSKYVVVAGGNLRGELRVPADKSISHRAVLLAWLARGESEIVNPLQSDDVRATLAAVRACGATVEEDKNIWRVRGGAVHSPAEKIDCGNSGTLMRLFCGLAAGGNISCELFGDDSLMRRPMARVVTPLAAMGADICAAVDGVPPIRIRPATLRGMTHQLPVASAQVKSAILLAGLRARGKTSVIEPMQSRDHTEKMLRQFGAAVEISELTTTVTGGEELRPARVEVPADMSSAAFFMAAAAAAAESDIVLKGVGVNPSRFGMVEILRRMGADVDVITIDEKPGPEPIADIRVCGGRLRGIAVDPDLVLQAIDDIPALCIAAAAAHGDTVFGGADELRVKESDRIAAMTAGLARLGVRSEDGADGFVVHGRGGEDTVFSGGEVDSRGDHRIAMAFATAGILARGQIIVHDCDNVATSFPNFPELARQAGLRVSAE